MPVVNCLYCERGEVNLADVSYHGARRQPMTFEIALVFVLLAGVVVLFATEKIPVDMITLLALSVLIGARVLTPSEAFSGFSSDLIVILGSIFVLGGALQYTGVLQRFVDGMLKLSGAGPLLPRLAQPVLMVGDRVLPPKLMKRVEAVGPSPRPSLTSFWRVLI